jgi:hypothetical protein
MMKKITLACWMGAGALNLLTVGPTFAENPKIVDGVAVEDAGDSGVAPTALSSSSIDFDTPQLFSDTLPLHVFQTFRTGAYFIGRGAVLDAASFEVIGTSGTSILAFNGRTAVNRDGSIPQLPELVVFLKPNLLGISRKKTVSVDVGSKRDEGRTVTLMAFNISLKVIDSASVRVSPQMQTLTVSSATPEIVFIGLFGEKELKVLAVDNLVYN